MKDLGNKIQQNLVLYVELCISAILLVVNVFFGFEIYRKIIEKVPPSTEVVEIDVPALNSLDNDLLDIFKEDHAKRTAYIENGGEEYENRWNSLENPRSPF